MHFDMGRNEVIEVIDHGVIAAAAEPRELLRRATSRAAAHRPQADRDHPARGPELHRRRQPRRSGRSGQFRIGFDPYEGLVLHQITLRRRRPRRARSCTARRSREMVVPYGDPGAAARLEERVRRGRVGPRAHDAAAHARLRLPRRDPLLRRDARERAGRAVGRSRTRSACTRRTTGSSGSTSTCFGGTQRGAPQPAARRELRRDGRQLRVRLLLVLLPRRQHPARGEAHRHRVADGDRAGHAARVRERRSRAGVAAPHHQHLFSARLDFDVDGTGQRGATRSRPSACRPAPTTRGATRSASAATRLETEARRAARHRLGDARARGRSSTRTCATASGQPVGYKLVPTMSTPTLLAHPDSPIGRRAGFAQHNLWVTPYAPDERRAAGEYPNQHAGGDGLPAWTAADRSIVGTDVVRLVHVRRHALRAARGLAGHAGRVHRLPARRRSGSSTATPRSTCRARRPLHTD